MVLDLILGVGGGGDLGPFSLIEAGLNERVLDLERFLKNENFIYYFNK